MYGTPDSWIPSWEDLENGARMLQLPQKFSGRGSGEKPCSRVEGLGPGVKTLNPKP